VLVGLFGLVRSLPPAATGPWLASQGRALAWVQHLERYGVWVGRLNGAALLACATILASWTWQRL